MNIKRRTLVFTIYLFVMFACSTSVAFAWETIRDPKTNIPTALEWQLDSKGVLTIQKRDKAKASETCEVPDWGKWCDEQGEVVWYGGTDKRPWRKKNISIKKLVLKSPVTSLGDFSFFCDYNNAFALKIVLLPPTMKRLGSRCFQTCQFLEMIQGTNNLKQIGNNAFEATALATFVWPKDVAEIAAETFRGCNKLKTITGLESVTKIGEGAFWCCAFENFHWPKGVTWVKDYTFMECSKLKSIFGLENVKKIESNAFSGTGFEKFNWPKKAKVINNSTFRGCENLNEITGIEDVTTIGTEAFSGTAFETFVVPHAVTVIERGTFSFMLKLKKVILSSETSLIAQNAFSACGALETITYEDDVEAKPGVANFPKTLQFILEDAFSNGEYTESDAPSIKTIVLPSSLRYLGKNSFANCKKLSQIIVKEPRKNISLGGVVFNGTNVFSNEKGKLIFCGSHERFERSGWNANSEDLFGEATKNNWNEPIYQIQN